MANNRQRNIGGEIIGMADIMFVTTAANSNSPNALNGSITINLGDSVSGEMFSQSAEIWGTPGILSVPALPDATTGNVDSAQGLYYCKNDQNVVFATRDTRSQALAGNINPGETCVYAPSGQARVVLKSDSSINLITTADGTDSTENIQFSFGPQGWYVNMPFGKLALDATGFRVSLASGASIALMGNADPTTGSSIVMNAGSCTINSGTIMLGTPVNMAVPLPVVYGIVPATAPGVPILGAGVGVVVVAAAASTSVFVGI